MLGMQPGFSYVGLVYLIMLILPNLFWIKHQPEGYEKVVGNENRGLVVLERIGEVAVSCLVFIFSDFNLRPWTCWSWWLVASFFLMLLYELYWIRYFRSEKKLEDFYRSLFGIPLAGATLPVAAFFLLAVYGRNPLLAGAVVVLEIGHIGIHWGHRRELG